MDRVLDAAMEIPGFDAAMMVVEGHGVAPTVATRGMSADETAKPPTSGRGRPPWNHHCHLPLRPRPPAAERRADLRWCLRSPDRA